jgi:hypothetical protein
LKSAERVKKEEKKGERDVRTTLLEKDRRRNIMISI